MMMTPFPEREREKVNNVRLKRIENVWNGIKSSDDLIILLLQFLSTAKNRHMLWIFLIYLWSNVSHAFGR